MTRTPPLTRLADARKRIDAKDDPVVAALNEAWAMPTQTDEPRHQVRIGDGTLITVKHAVSRREDGRLIVLGFESYTDPYLKRDEPAPSLYALTAAQEEALLTVATTLFVRWPASMGSGLRRGKAHG